MATVAAGAGNANAAQTVAAPAVATKKVPKKVVPVKLRDNLKEEMMKASKKVDQTEFENLARKLQRRVDASKGQPDRKHKNALDAARAAVASVIAELEKQYPNKREMAKDLRKGRRKKWIDDVRKVQQGLRQVPHVSSLRLLAFCPIVQNVPIFCFLFQGG